MQLKNYENAVADYERARRFDSAVAEAYHLYAKSLAAKGEKEKAAKARSRAQALNPDFK